MQFKNLNWLCLFLVIVILSSCSKSINVYEEEAEKITFMTTTKAAGSVTQVPDSIPQNPGSEEMGCALPIAPQGGFKQFIILKADDLNFDRNHIVTLQWQRFINYILEKNIKAALGLIGNSLEKGNAAYIDYIKNLDSTGNFEIWNHGFDHIVNQVNERGERYHEFRNTSFEYQKTQLLKTQELARQKLNMTLHAFGAPGNAYDQNTIAALAEIKELKVWFFGPQNSSLLALKRYSEIEYPTHNPDYQKFMQFYNPKREYLALQIHPNSWNDQRFEEFKKIIEQLIADGATFITPCQYYRYLQILQ